jgi:gamma-glutamylcyclotransferase (GGCT)/AIG2-like uncharacterized protein YtfP
MKKVFFYGSLKRDGFNFKRFASGREKEIVFVQEMTIPGFTIYNTGCTYPAAIKCPEKSIEGEVFEVSEEVFESVSNMERGAGYISELIDDVIIFYMTREKFKHRHGELTKKNHIGRVWENWWWNK